MQPIVLVCDLEPACHGPWTSVEQSIKREHSCRQREVWIGPFTSFKSCERGVSLSRLLVGLRAQPKKRDGHNPHAKCDCDDTDHPKTVASIFLLFSKVRLQLLHTKRVMARFVLAFKVPTTPSSSIREASKRSIQFYRDCLKSLPLIVQQVWISTQKKIKMKAVVGTLKFSKSSIL
jgi:hypothetical protein